jgi:methyltransferase
MPKAQAIAIITLLAVVLVMAGEAVLASFNERLLLARGAREAPHDVYRTMRWAYPGCFIMMAIEGAWRGPSPPAVLLSGLALFGLAKALKAWAIAALGPRWTFKVIVPPSPSLVTSGPYRLINHPNYVAVVGELLGFAAIVFAPITGVAALIGFGSLMRARIRVEDRALGRTESR